MNSQPLMLLGLLATVILHAASRSLNSNYHNLFSASIYKELKKHNTGNFAVCPLSAQLILGLVHAVAEGTTAEELSSALHLPQDKEVTQEIFRALKPQLQGNEHYNLNSANKVYVKNGYEVEGAFKKLAEDIFGAEIQNIDFKENKEAAEEMNQWVENKTHDKIQNLISETDIDEDTRSILINAMYFQANWTNQFNVEKTIRKPFHVNDTITSETNMMTQTSYYNYFENKDYKAKFLEMPFLGGEASMIFILPNEKEGLNALEENMDQVLAAPQYKNEKVHVEIPKFTVESKIDFKKILQDLGALKAFTDAADIRQILVDQSLKISQVLQKSFLEVKEAGATAAAATFVSVSRIRSGHRNPQPIMEFFADHPFIYYIKIKDVVFFVGRYISP